MTVAHPCKENICAVVVTYHPDPALSERVTEVARQVATVVVVDNGSSPASLERLHRLAGPGVHFILNGENLGVGAALNRGLTWALEQGYLWALTLDQDTEVLPDLVDALSRVHAACPGPVGILGCNYYDANTGLLFDPSKRDGPGYQLAKVVITSGSLLLLSVFKAVGPFREEFFIDSIDHEYCFRLQARGYAVLFSFKPGMVHSLGTQKVHRFFWKRPITSNHPPFRHYYITRNRLVLAREYAATQTAWLSQDGLNACKAVLFVLLYEDQKVSKLKATALGALHAMTGRMGKLDHNF